MNELPALHQAENNQIRILTKMGIPIFLQPAQPQTRGHIENMVIRDGIVSFKVVNNGNVHFVARKVQIRAMGSEGEVFLENEMDGWYILAGGIRDYKLKLPHEDCVRTKILLVEVGTEDGSFKENLAVRPGACQ